MHIRDSVVLVTGASSGLGRAAAERLAGAGARLIAHGRDEAALADLAARTGAVDRLIAVNLASPVRLTRAVLPAMLAAGRGYLAFVGSIAGRTGVAGEALYAATKAGLDTFAESLRF